MEPDPYIENFASGDEHEPAAENLRAVRDRIASLRADGRLRSDSEYDASKALFALGIAIDDLKHLQRNVGRGGPETRAGSRVQLEKLSQALARLSSAAKEVDSQVGVPPYAPLSETSYRWLAAILSERGGGENDPLKWQGSGSLFVGGILEWTEFASNAVDETVAAMAKPGHEKGSPDQFFARRCLEIWMRLDGSPHSPTRLPSIKLLAAWLELTFRAADEKREPGTLKNLAESARADLKARLRLG